MGGPEAGSEPFFFPKFPVQSTVSLWMTTADMAASPGAGSAWRRILSTLEEKSRRLGVRAQRHTLPLICTPCLAPLHCLPPTPVAGGQPSEPPDLRSQTMPHGVGPPTPAVSRAVALESVLHVGLPQEDFCSNKHFLVKLQEEGGDKTTDVVEPLSGTLVLENLLLTDGPRFSLNIY